MAKPGFWNDNRFRAYPFLRGSIGLSGSGAVANTPNEVIVDVGFTMGLNSGYVAGTHIVWLDSVSRSGSVVSFQFKSDAPGLTDKPLTFVRDIASDDYEIEYVDRLEEADDSESASASFSYSGDDACDDQPLWSGFLVTGQLDGFSIGDGENWTSATAEVEPATVSSLVNSYVSDANVGNADRTRVNAAENCPPIDWEYPVGDGVIHIQQTCLQGHIRFMPGYNSEIEQIDGDNQLVFTADLGAGEGNSCDGIPLFPAESTPEGSTLYEGGPRCSEVLRSINGLGGQLLTLLNGTGVNITEVPDQNKLVLDIDMRGLALCYTDIIDVSESLSE